MDFKEARKAKGLTLEQASTLAGYSIPTINALELEGRGSDRLKSRLTEIYGLAPEPAALRETSPPYNVPESRVDDFFAELRKLKDQMMAVERAAEKMKPVSSGRKRISGTSDPAKVPIPPAVEEHGREVAAKIAAHGSHFEGPDKGTKKDDHSSK